MASANVEQFNAQVLRLIGELYEFHPRPRAFDVFELTGKGPDDPITRDDSEIVGGTMSWLVNNGYISGDFNQHMVELNNVQLTAYSWRVLQSQEPNTSVQPLGEAVKQARTMGEREIRVVGEILVRRLTGD